MVKPLEGYYFLLLSNIYFLPDPCNNLYSQRSISKSLIRHFEVVIMLWIVRIVMEASAFLSHLGSTGDQVTVSL